MSYKIELSPLEFFTLLRGAISADKSTRSGSLAVLEKIAFDSPELLTEMLKLPQSKKANPDEVFDYLVLKNQFSMINSVLNTPLGADIINYKILTDIKASKKGVIKGDKLWGGGLSSLANSLNNTSNNGLEIDGKILPIFNSIADILLKPENKFITSQLLNLKVERPLINEKTNKVIPNEYKYEALLFQLLPIFEGRMGELDKTEIVDWYAKNSSGETVLNKAFTFRSDITAFLIEKMVKNDASHNDINNLDIGLNKIDSAKQWADIITRDIVDWSTYPAKYKNILKKTISAYPNGGEDLRASLSTIFSYLIQLPVLATEEGQAAIAGINQNPKNTDLQSIYMHQKLQDNLQINPTSSKKIKI